jgi:hypothetical protein
MTDPLNDAAYELCASIRRGAFADELKRARNQQPTACPAVIDALRSKCPGFTTENYQAAIARGMRDSLF